MRLVWVALLVCSTVAGAGPACAQPRVPVSAANGMVSIAGHPLLRFRTALGGVPPDQRADIVALRIQELLGRGVRPHSVHTAKEGRCVAVYFGGALLVSVSPEEARSQGSLPQSLAALWAHRLRTLLSTPLLTVSKTRLVVPLGETRSVTFGGLLRSAHTVTSDTDVAAATLDAQGRRATVRGLRAGDARLVFSHEGASVAVDVRVRPYAGRLPQAAEATVTGHPAPPEILSRMAAAAAREAVWTQPGASRHVGRPNVRSALRAGRDTCVFVPVRLEGLGYLPVAGRVPVTVRNLRLPPAPAPQLFYSNHPEQVQGYGTLFLGRLCDDRPARLLYHHQNAMGRRFALTVDVVNPGDTPVRLHVVEGITEPVADPLAAGHFAARSFLAHQRAGVGYVTTLAPRSLVTVAHHVVEPWKVASGILGLRQLDAGAGCFVQVKVDDLHSPFVRPPDGTEALSATVFGSAVKPIAAVYEVGGRWTFIRLGSAQQGGAARLSEEGFGDYGVTYDISLTISNPTSHSQKVGLVFEAASGKARGLFVVDGKTVETPALDAHDEMVLAVRLLRPGAMCSMRVTTLPLSGSAYPARLVLRELPAEAAIRPGTFLRPH